MALVLIADADVDFCIVLMQALEASGHDTRIAQDGDEAWDMLASRNPAAIILGSDLPGMNALPFLMRMRAEGYQLPAIVLSRDGTATEAIRCMKAGAEDFLLRPRSPDRLLEMLLPLIDNTGSAAPTWMRDLPPDAIPGYRLLRSIGNGSYGAVYLAISAQNPEGAAPVAIKILLRDRLADGDKEEEAISRFRREAHVASRIHHPNVVQVIDFDIAPTAPYPYLVLEYVEGRQLDSIEPEDLSPAAACWIVQQLAAGLSAIHAIGCVHRDVKPANAVICADDTLRILDFGSVVVPSSELTSTGNTIGTPLYMAPETFASSKVDARADIFSLGVVAYELLARRLPFEGRSVGAVTEAILHKEPIPPFIFNSEIPESINDMIMRMLVKDPNARLQTAAEVAALCAGVTGRPTPTRRPTTPPGDA